MGPHDVLGDRQTQAGAARFAGSGLIHAIETLEQSRQMLGRDARTEISYVEFDARASAARAPSSTRPPERPYFMALSIRLENT